MVRFCSEAIMGAMDTTPEKDLVSEIEDADPADAVEPAEALADELESSLAVEEGETPEPSPS